MGLKSKVLGDEGKGVTSFPRPASSGERPIDIGFCHIEKLD
jgi:hypothetical protein